MPNRKSLTWVLMGYFVGLGLLGVYFRNALNTDAVAYLRIASYYSAGKLDLAISGYWAPLMSWVISPLLKVGLPQLAAARTVMGLSALVFLGGGIALYRVFRLPEKWVLTGAILTAACGLYWSVRFITPDLLLAGLVAIAVCCLIKGRASQTVWNEVAAGALWALAYLAKAVAFPLAILTTLSLGGLVLIKHKSLERASCVRKMLTTLLAFALVAGPWVAVLSIKYGRPTFSTAARISHALTGPSDSERYHPFARTFHRPEPGRVTSWEDPSNMAYNFWSPFESPAYAWQQVQVVVLNLLLFLLLLTSLNFAWVFVPLDILQARRGNNREHPTPQYFQALMVPLWLLLLYLPASVMLSEQRFFYPAFPFLFVAVALWASNQPKTQHCGTAIEDGGSKMEDGKNSLPTAWQVCSGLRAISYIGTLGTRALQRRQKRRWWLAVLGVILPLSATVLVLGRSPKYAGDHAVELAQRMSSATLAGPIAGSGLLPGGRAGLYLAFLLNQPWYGDELHPTTVRLKASGARFIVVIRRSELARTLSGDADFVDCDERLFGTKEPGSPLQVYEVKGWQAAAGR